jgi:hypothetical protein
MFRLFAGLAGILCTSAHLFAQIPVKDDFIKAGETQTLTANNTYLLDGFVFVEDGATLIIEPGTVIKGKQQPSTGDNASALIVARGGKIFAEGTPEQPIIFTSELDNLNIANDVSWDDRGLWGGMIILGRATTNRGIDGQVEGIPSGESRAAYGGNDDHDFSGILRYVSIRHSGAELSPGDEINGLTLGAVGDRTIVEFVEVFANLDDGFEWFGGTVNTRNLVAAFCADDCFDYDEGWRGKNQFWLGIQGADAGGRIAEQDGGTINETAPPFATPEIRNATYIGPGKANKPQGDGSEALIFRDNAGGHYINCIITEYNGANNGRAITVEDTEGEDSRSRMENGQLTLRNNLWWNFGNGNQLDLICHQDFVRAHFQANGNQIADPALRQLAWDTHQMLDPRPAAHGPAAYGAAPSNNSYFHNVAFMGAFSPAAALWTDGWTALYDEKHTAKVAADERMVSHVTRSGGGFQTTINLSNPGSNPADLTLQPYAANGTMLSAKNLSVSGNWSEAASTLFGAEEVSHFTVEGPNAVACFVTYKAASGEAASAQVSAARNTVRSFSFAPAEQAVVFDGFALVNLGSAASTVEIALLDGQGAVLSTSTLTADLAPMAKTLHTFDNTDLSGVALIRVTSTQDSAVTVLRGTRVGVTPGYLYQTVPLP